MYTLMNGKNEKNRPFLFLYSLRMVSNFSEGEKEVTKYRDNRMVREKHLPSTIF